MSLYEKCWKTSIVDLKWATLFMLVAVGLLYSCKSSRNVSGDAASRKESKVKQRVEAADESEDLDQFLAQYRSSLRDLYASQRHDYPPSFEKKEKSVRKNQLPDFRGFRIQLISTRNVSMADSARKQLQQWLRSHPTIYKPESYIVFRQPYYRLHVGDFQSRERAIKYSRLLKPRFPAAWVVHDRINPDRVPPDTLDLDAQVDTLRQAIPDTTTTEADSLFIEEKK